MSYCVICCHQLEGTTRIVGPFDSKGAAVGWATTMRSQNESWNYMPDVLMPPVGADVSR